jgi:hypothetical protein
MREPRMTVGQLAMAVDTKDQIFLKSMIDLRDEMLVELTMNARAFPGVMSMEVYTLSYLEGKGFIATVGMPREVLTAVGKATE